MAAVTLDVQRIIDEQPFRGYHLRLAALCAVAVFMDGYDAQAIGFVAPALTKAWSIPRAALSPVLSSGLLGMLIGALVFGPLADRFGRKRILVLCTLWFGLFSVLTARADSIQSMIVLRLITGLGLGGTMPNAIALTSEYMPKRLRATGVMLMFTGFSIGAAVGGLVAASLISRFGWQSVFVVGGILPCLTAIFLLRLPESVRFLVLKGGADSTVAKLLRKAAPEVAIPAGASFVVTERRETGFLVGRLFSEGRTRLTLLLWVLFFMSLLDLFFLNSWLPTIINDTGISLEVAIVITSMFQLGGAAGCFVLGRMFDRSASYRPLAWAYLGASACVVLIGLATSSVAALTFTVFGAGFGVVGAQTGANSLAAESYPTSVRSTGVGWALGIGRIGSILGPVLGGMLLSSPQVKIERVFWAAAVPPLIATAAAFALNLRSRNAVARQEAARIGSASGV
jgi:AAHS family 4-hydroxybenzoate transporter-like MFS transporter